MSIITVEQLFKNIMFDCNPRYNITEMVLGMFFGGTEKQEPNFVGGCGDFRRTTHEKVFSLLYPHLKQQVVFGTGKGGLKEYFSKKFTVDFYDEERKTIYEIDGRTHKHPRRENKDRLRECFFVLEHRIQTVRFTNKQVEEMLMERLRKIESKGRLGELINQNKST